MQVWHCNSTNTNTTLTCGLTTRLLPRSLRIYDLPTDAFQAQAAGPVSRELDAQLASGPDSLQVALQISEGELVYDYCWYPQMLASDPASCCLASSCRVGGCGPLLVWLLHLHEACGRISEVPRASISCGTNGWHLPCPACVIRLSSMCDQVVQHV